MILSLKPLNSLKHYVTSNQMFSIPVYPASFYSQMTVTAKNIVLATGGRPKYPTHVSVRASADGHAWVLSFHYVTLFC